MYFPDELVELNQWVGWKLGKVNDKGKRGKVPINLNAPPGTRNYASVTNPDHWTTFDVAAAALAAGTVKGIGFCFTKNDPFCFVDLDNCFESNGILNPAAANAASLMHGTYAEISQSGKGLHFVCKADLANKVATGAIDIYPADQYCAMTGNVYGGEYPAVAKQTEIEELARVLRASSKPAAEPPLNIADHELLNIARNAKNGATFDALWRGDLAGYGDDHSAADYALIMILIFYCNSDIQRVDRLFRQSGLMREKWDEKHYQDGKTYGQGTIDRAVENFNGKPFRFSDDTSDAEHGRKVADDLLRASQRNQGSAKSPNRDSPQYVSYSELAAMKFPEPSWILPDILPDSGLYLLAGKPKCGKSWLALSLSLAITNGGSCLGRRVKKGRVLYLALEDTPRRFASRLFTIQPDAILNPAIRAALDNGLFTPTFPAIGRGFENAIKDAIVGQDVRLVIIDTLAKVRPVGAGSGNRYDDDYKAISALKAVADDHGICVLVLHHVRKQDSDDPHDTVSGTNGIAGAADGTLVLVRQRGGDGSATLSVTGRDLPENEFGLKFKDGFWQFVGNAEEIRASKEQNEIVSALREFGGEGATAKRLAEETGKNPPAVKFLLRKLVDAGRVRVRNTKPAPHYALCDGPAAPQDPYQV